MVPKNRRLRGHIEEVAPGSLGRGMPDISSPHGLRGGGRQGVFIERIAGWSIRHRALAIGGWLALVVVALLASGLLSGASAGVNDPGESGDVKRVVRAQDSYEPVLENVLIQPLGKGGGKFTDNPALVSATQDLVAEFGKTPGMVTGLRTPLSPATEKQISDDGRSGLVTFFVAGPNDKMDAHIDGVIAAVKAVAERHQDVRVVEAGDVSLSRAIDDAVRARCPGSAAAGQPRRSPGPGTGWRVPWSPVPRCGAAGRCWCCS
jgi:RND superfamily putative drug exporter